MSGKIENLAPPDEIVRYLAVFERCFRYVRDAGERRNRDAMLLGGHLADALHNVPELLCRWGMDDWHQGGRFERALSHGWEVPESHGAPPGSVQVCRDLLAPERQPGELGLQPDLSDLDLAPPERLAYYLDCLYGACLNLRTIRSFGFPAPEEDVPFFWRTGGDCWLPDGEEHGRFNGALAGLYLPVPQALVSWGCFDEPAFWTEAERSWTARFGAESWERVRP